MPTSSRPASVSRRTALVAALLLPGLLSASQSSATASPEAQIRRIDAERMTALLEGDFAALKGLIDPDCVYTHASGLVESGADYIHRLERGDLRYLAMQYATTPSVRIHGDRTAVVSGRVQLTSQGRASAAPNDRVMIATAVYVREGADWRMVSYQSTPAPAPTPAP